MLREFQAAFAESLVGRPDGGAPGMAVYRENVSAALTSVVASTYARCRRALGADAFDALTCAYVGADPPRTPRLYAYGGGFADFLERTAMPPPPNRHCLADLARLEWARTEACFAPDDAPLAPGDLAAIPRGHYPGLRFALHPASRLISVSYPVSRFWERPEGAVSADPAPETLLATRPRLEVSHAILSRADSALVTALAGGGTLEQAAADAYAQDPAFDLQGALYAHLRRGTFARILAGRAPAGEGGAVE